MRCDCLLLRNTALQQGDILLGVSVLPVDEQDGVPKDDWRWEEGAERLSRSTVQQVLVCIVQRSMLGEI